MFVCLYVWNSGEEELKMETGNGGGDSGSAGAMAVVIVQIA